MKILFAVSNEKISQSIIKKYETLYKEIISSKNVYYFNAILKELGKDKSYDRIVISEDLEPFSNKNYELTDNFVFEKLDKISDEAVDNAGEDIPIILIASDRHTKGDPILSKLFGIGIYSGLLGQDRTVQNLCELINKPRTKREAKAYYKINTTEVDYKTENENNVSEIEIQNILSHYKKLGKNEEKYVESFDKIASQYTDQQLKVIIKFLPIGVKAVLEANSPKYQQIATFQTENETLRNQKPYSSTQINPKTNKPRSTQQAVVDNGIKIELIESKETKKPTKPVIIPATMSTNNVKKIKKSSKVEEKEEKEEKQLEIEDITNEKLKNEGLGMRDMEEVNQEPKKGRGRPKKILTQEEIDAIKAKQKRGRGRPRKNQEPQEETVESVETVDTVDTLDNTDILDTVDNVENTEEVTNLIGNNENEALNDLEEEVSLPGFQDEPEETSITEEPEETVENKVPSSNSDGPSLDLDFDEFFDDFDVNEDANLTIKPSEKIETEKPKVEEDESGLGDLIIDEPEKDIDEIIGNDEAEEDKKQEVPATENDKNVVSNNKEAEEDDDDFMLDFDFDEDNSNFQGYNNDTDLKVKEQNITEDISKQTDDNFTLDLDEPSMPGVEETERGLSKHQHNYSFSNDEDDSEIIQSSKPSYEDIYMDDEEDVVDTDMPDYGNTSVNQQIANYNNSSDEENVQSLLSSDQKIVAFVGTTKNGTSFLVNNLADLFSRQGIKTAILDLTKNKNSYYIYTKNEENLRKKAIDSITRLANGIADGVPVNKNLDVYTSLPGEKSDALDQYENVLKALAKEYSLVLIDCDFNTNYGFIRESQEIYLVQSMDVLTIQPLTAYLRDLKAKNVLDQEKLRIVINKSTRVRSVTEKTIIGGMAFYNDPSMSFMTELFDREKIKYAVVPFDPQTYSKYLEGLVNCSISIDEYSKDFLGYLRRLGNMVYPLIANNNNNGPMNRREDTSFNKYETRDTFSNNVNNTLNKMKEKF